MIRLAQPLDRGQLLIGAPPDRFGVIRGMAQNSGSLALTYCSSIILPALILFGLGRTVRDQNSHRSN